MGPQIDLPVIEEELVLTRAGVWLSNGQPIEHERTIEAFCRSIRREQGQGRYRLEIGSEKIPIHIELYPIFVLRSQWADDCALFELSDGTQEKLLRHQIDSRISIPTDGSTELKLERWGHEERAGFMRSAHCDFLSGALERGWVSEKHV
jgi:hypothetical protein